MQWNEVRPILQAAYDSLERPQSGRGLGHLVQMTGSEEINRTLGREPDDRRLDVPLKYLQDAGYFENSYRAGDGSWVNISLSEKSLQLVAGWPRPGDDLYDRLLTILEQRIDEAPTADEKSRAEKLRAALASAGKNLVVEVIGNVATKGL